MESDPEALSEKDEQPSVGAINPYVKLKRRYQSLQKVALQTQTFVDDIASVRRRGAVGAAMPCRQAYVTAAAMLTSSCPAQGPV